MAGHCHRLPQLSSFSTYAHTCPHCASQGTQVSLIDYHCIAIVASTPPRMHILPFIQHLLSFFLSFFHIVCLFVCLLAVCFWFLLSSYVHYSVYSLCFFLLLPSLLFHLCFIGSICCLYGMVFLLLFLLLFLFMYLVYAIVCYVMLTYLFFCSSVPVVAHYTAL